MTDPWDGYILPTKKTISLRSQMYVNVIPVDPSWVILLHEISIHDLDEFQSIISKVDDEKRPVSQVLNSSKTRW